MDIFSEIDAMPGLLAFINEKSLNRCLDFMTASAIACSRAPFPIKSTLIMVFLLTHFFCGRLYPHAYHVTLILKLLPFSSQNIGKNHPRQTKLMAH
jgi:hypothetical protein